MTAFLLRRIGRAVIFVLVVSASAIVLVRLAPGDAATDLEISVADASVAADMRARLGLDRPVHEQIARWLSGVVRLDLGQSSRFGRPVADLVWEHALNTARLASLALAIATVCGLLLGIITGSRPRSVIGVVVSTLSVLLVSCPPIVATLALLFFAAATGVLSIEPGHLALPTLALALPLAAVLERLQAQAIAEALAEPGIAAASARGVPATRVLWFHAGRQALRPVLGVYGVVIATMFSGSVAVETVTAWPGLGRLTLDAVLSRDLYLVAGCVLAGAVLIMAGNLVADLLRAAADPRVREATS